MSYIDEVLTIIEAKLDEANADMGEAVAEWDDLLAQPFWKFWLRRRTEAAELRVDILARLQDNLLDQATSFRRLKRLEAS